MKNKIAQVVVDLPVEGPFDYEIPMTLSHPLVIGQRVLVSFRAQTIVGYVVGLKATSAFKHLKPILSVLDKNPVLSSALLDLARKFSCDYCCSMGQAIAAFLPAYFRKTKKEIVFSLKTNDEKKEVQPETLLAQDISLKKFWPAVIERIRQVTARGASVIILVPENDRIVWAVKELQNSGINEPIATFDKQRPDKAQLEDWVFVKEGKARIVIGTRSVIFAPTAFLGLIVVVDENNFSYKQDQSPFYHARHVASMRARIEKAHLIFVARSPSVDLYYEAKRKKISFLDVPVDISSCACHVIDMSNYKYGKSQLVSIPLLHAIERALAQKGKVLLLMNKKGFGSFGVCAKCQHILKCPRCDVPLTFLYESKQVVCRYCNYRALYPSVCPQCQGAYLNFSGMGVEKLESEVARLFPTARVQCYVKESERTPHDFNILIATQAVLRLEGDVVFDTTCVVQVDSELNRLDFQAGENIFSLLMHLKSMTKEKFFIQTHLRDNYCLKAFLENKPELFFKKELTLRKELHFPPLASMAEIVLRSANEQAAMHQADLLFNTLIQKKRKGIEILPPQILSLARLREQYRFVIVIKGVSRKVLANFIRQGLSSVQRASRAITTVNLYP